MSDWAREAIAYGHLGNAYQSLGDFQKAIEYHGRNLKIAIEVGDRVGEARAYGNLGKVYDSLGNYQKVIECNEKHMKIFTEMRDRPEE